MSKTSISFSNILIPIDFSAASEKAAEYALALAKRDKAVLNVIHVVNVNNDIAAFFVSSGLEDMTGEAELKLKKFQQKNLKGYTNIKTSVLSGVPHQQVVSFAKKHKCDLIVIGSHGKGSVDRLLVGSNTERVLRKTTCPVMVVPASKK